MAAEDHDDAATNNIKSSLLLCNISLKGWFWYLLAPLFSHGSICKSSASTHLLLIPFWLASLRLLWSEATGEGSQFIERKGKQSLCSSLSLGVMKQHLFGNSTTNKFCRPFIIKFWSGKRRRPTTRMIFFFTRSLI